MKVKYIIVDDEPIAHRVIEQYCRELPFMHLLANCYDALQALEVLKRQQADLLFLDINMPKLTGFDFLRTLNDAPQVVVTSAYQEYALEGFELDVCDYLLKPFGFERFVKAVNKAMTTVSRGDHPALGLGRAGLFIKGDKKYHQIRLADILYIEACGNYSNVVLKRTEIITPEKISSVEKMLPPEGFIRVHKSFIAAVSKIDEIEGTQIKLGSKTIPVGRVYKVNVDRLIDN